MRAMNSRELYREETHGAGAAMHQHALAGLQPRPIEQSLPRGQRANRH